MKSFMEAVYDAPLTSIHKFLIRNFDVKAERQVYRFIADSPLQSGYSICDALVTIDLE